MIAFEQIPGLLEQILEKMTSLEEKMSSLEDRYNNAPTLPEDFNESLTLQEAGEYLKVTRQTIHKWIREKRIPYSKIGSKTYFKKHDLDSVNKIEIKKPKGLRY